MFNRRTAAIVAAAIAFSGLTLTPACAADLKSPDQVKVALRLMMQVTNDFKQQIARKAYVRLPHENQEFQEASGALVKAIADEPKAFHAKADPAIKHAAATAQKVADQSATGSEAQLNAGQAQLLKSVNAVFAYFPMDLRPDPNVQPSRPPAAPAAGN